MRVALLHAEISVGVKAGLNEGGRKGGRGDRSDDGFSVWGFYVCQEKEEWVGPSTNISDTLPYPKKINKTQSVVATLAKSLIHNPGRKHRQDTLLAVVDKA